MAVRSHQTKKSDFSFTRPNLRAYPINYQSPLVVSQSATSVSYLVVGEDYEEGIMARARAKRKLLRVDQHLVSDVDGLTDGIMPPPPQFAFLWTSLRLPFGHDSGLLR